MYLRQVPLTQHLLALRITFLIVERTHKLVWWLNLNLFSELESPRLKQLYDHPEDRAMFVIESFN